MTKQKWLKRMSVALAGVMLTATLQGCGGESGNSGSDTSQAASQQAASGDSQAASQTSESESGEREKLVIGIRTSAWITDYENNYLTKRLEDDLGVDIEFMFLSSDSAETKTQISLMATGGEAVPDVICVDSFGQGDMAVFNYGQNGFFIPLQDYLNDPEKTPYFNSVIREEDRQLMLTASTYADGNIYGLPNYEPNLYDVNATPYRMYINQSWLDKLELTMPTTTDELYDVLKAFAAKDPNGNGQADEIPLFGWYGTGGTGGGYGQSIVVALMNSFIFAPNITTLTLDETGSKVIAPYVQDEWREGLEYLHRLCEEGLMPASVFTVDKTQFAAVLSNPDVNLVGMVSSGNDTGWADNQDNLLDMVIMEPLKGPEGVQYTPYSKTLPRPRWYVTSACENPELAVKVGDYFYNAEISNVARYGVPGVNWTDDESVVNDPAYSNTLIEAGLYTGERFIAEIETAWDVSTDAHWSSVVPRYRTPEYFAGVVTKRDSETTGDSSPDPRDRTYWNYMYYSDKVPEKVLAGLIYTLEEAEENTEVSTAVGEYVIQNTAQFIVGERALNDAEWEKYKSELENMGYLTLIKNAQAAYDRQNQ